MPVSVMHHAGSVAGHLRLPSGWQAAAQHACAAAMWSAMSHSARLACRRILIVEDELIIAWHLGEIVEQLGCEICGSATTEAEAVRLALTSRPDLVLMDVRLGRGGDGIMAAQRIRAMLSVPIVFCSAYASDPVTLERMRAAGAAGILAKPILPDQLGAMLSRIFRAPDTA
jgi:CheY-like chemotaxis protein